MLFDNGTPLRRLAFPLVVIGANSIFIYCAYHLTNGWVRQHPGRHLVLPEKTWDFKTYEVFGPAYAPAVRGALVILILLAGAALDVPSGDLRGRSRRAIPFH